MGTFLRRFTISGEIQSTDEQTSNPFERWAPENHYLNTVSHVGPQSFEPLLHLFETLHHFPRQQDNNP